MMRLVILGVTAVGLMACGPGAKIGGGSDGAAQAFFMGSKATKAGSDKATTPVDLTGAVSWSCPEGGKAELNGFGIGINTGGGTADVTQSFTVKYDNCGVAKADVGTAVFNGSWTVSQAITTTSTSVDVDQSIKGNVKVQGAFDDFLDVDISQKISVTALGTGSGAVNMDLNGSITDSSGTFTYAGSLSVDSSGIQAQLPPKN